MKINSVNGSFCVNKQLNSNTNRTTPVFSGNVQKNNDTVSVYSNGKAGRALAGLANIFHINAEQEEAKAKKSVPSVLDSAYVRAGVTSHKQAALTMRYGNSNISDVQPEVAEKVKNNLNTMGIEDINDENLKLIRIADSDKEMRVYKRLSYFDEASKKSIIFTPDGDMDYKVKYEYSPVGTIKGFAISDIYINGAWMEK